MTKKINKNLFLIIAVILLSLLYGISFIKTKNTRKSIKTVLINGKYLNSIKSIEITQGEKSINIKKQKKHYLYQPEVWIITNDLNQTISADQQKVNNFIKNLCTVREVYEVAEKIDTENDHFGLLKDSAIHINYEYDDNSFNEIIIGDKNFAQTGRYLMSGKSVKVYEIDDFLEPYLYTSLLQWADPDIISKNVLKDFKEENIQQIQIRNRWSLPHNQMVDAGNTKDFSEKVHKLLQFRHSGFAEVEEPDFDEHSKAIFLYMGNKDRINIYFYPYKKNIEDNLSYYVKIMYEEHNSEEGYATRNVLIESKTISKWTYDAINDLFSE